MWAYYIFVYQNVFIKNFTRKKSDTLKKKIWRVWKCLRDYSINCVLIPVIYILTQHYVFDNDHYCDKKLASAIYNDLRVSFICFSCILSMKWIVDDSRLLTAIYVIADGNRVRSLFQSIALLQIGLNGS